MEWIVEIAGLTKTFGKEEVLNNIHLTIQKGEVFGLIGPDGAGKSTLLRIIAGLISPTQGIVKVFGKDIAEQGESVRNLIGYLPQGATLYPDLTVSEILKFFLTAYGILEDKNEDWISYLLGITNLQGFRHYESASLSGGMKQKLALACAVVHKPQLVLLDEPTTGLDPVSRLEIWDFLNTLNKQGLTFIVSTPYMEEVERFSRIGFLHRGKITAVGRPSDLKSRMRGKLFVMKCMDFGSIRKMIQSLDFIKGVRSSGDRIYIWVESKEDGERIAEYMKKKGFQEFTLMETEFSTGDLFNFFKEKGSFTEE